MSRPPPRLRDRTLDADGGDPVPSASPPETNVVDVACWTPVSTSGEAASGVPSEPRATLLAEPSVTGAADGPVAHTLVLEVDGPMASVELDYRPLDATVVPDRRVRARTDDDRPIAIDESWISADGTFTVAFAERPTSGALFLEYSVTRNPDGGQHAVSVVVDGERRTEARLVVVG